MKRVMKWVGIGLAVAAGVALVAAVGMVLATDLRLAKTYTVPVAPPPIPGDAAAPARGQHLAEVYCARCHGDRLEGAPLFADASLGTVDAPNLTGGRGGVGAAYTDADWVRAIRHGIRPDGRALFIMPAGDFQHLGAGDLAALIAYLKSVPPVDNETRARTFTPLARFLYTTGAFGNLIPAEWIDHAAVEQEAAAVPQQGPTAEYGAYVATLGGCGGCHKPDLGGGTDDPSAPPAPNLTPGGELQGWQEADFVRLMRTGTTPTGRQVSDYMPWKAYGRLHDEELAALWQYLLGVPAVR